jgi:hypothetical protein
MGLAAPATQRGPYYSQSACAGNQRSNATTLCGGLIWVSTTSKVAWAIRFGNCSPTLAAFVFPIRLEYRAHPVYGIFSGSCVYIKAGWNKNASSLSMFETNIPLQATNVGIGQVFCLNH